MKNWNQILSGIVRRTYMLMQNITDDAFIIMFHYVTKCKVDEIKIHPLTGGNHVLPMCHCTEKEFEHILDSVQSRGYKFVSLDEYIASLEKKPLKKVCIVTFDDGTNDLFEVAYPILCKRKIPFTAYIPSAFVDVEGCLTLLQLRQMVRNPLCTIGAHTVHHVNLRKTEKLYDEIVESKKQLEDMTSCTVKHFAYPWGSVNAVPLKALLVVKKAGFDSAVSTISSTLNIGSTRNRYFLPRINMDSFK